MRDGLRPAEREALYAPDRRMDAYYFGFNSTGIPAIDAILSAVACAGKSYHSTDQWADDDDEYGRWGVGRSLADVIQAAANEAASQWPTDHTAAIAEAAREYVRVLDAWARGEGVSRAAALNALAAAVDAERTEREGK